MSVVLPLKSQSDPVVSSAVMKRQQVTNPQNTVSGFVWCEVYLLLPFSADAEERNRVWAELSYRQREINHRKTIEVDTDLDDIFLVYCCCSLGAQLASSGWTGPVRCCRLATTQNSLKMGGVIFGLSSHLHGSSSTNFIFLFSIPRSLWRLLCWSSFSQLQAVADLPLIHFNF